MKPHARLNAALLVGTLLLFTHATRAQSRMENLGRGVVAVRTATGVYVGWRMLGTDPSNIAFNLYRATGDGEPVKINAAPITDSTNYVDTGVDTTKANAYFVRPVIAGVEKERSKSFLNKLA